MALVCINLLVSFVHQLVSSADQLEIVIPHELCGDFGPEQPASPPGGDSPVLHLRQCHEET